MRLSSEFGNQKVKIVCSIFGQQVAVRALVIEFATNLAIFTAAAGSFQLKPKCELKQDCEGESI